MTHQGYHVTQPTDGRLLTRTVARRQHNTVDIHLLLADDDTILSDLLAKYLRGEGVHVTQVFDGQAAVERALAETYDLIVLDVMMPKMDGLAALRTIRAQRQTPILMLTARGDDIDRILGLEMGADDYVPKPCHPRELLARIRAILRRSTQPPMPSTAERITVDDLVLDTGDRSVRVDGALVPLTSTEFAVLEQLLRQPGQVIRKDMLSQQALTRKLGPYDRSLDMHISNLRKKLGRLPDGEPRIKTVRGIGYLYVRREDDASCAACS